MNAPQDSATAGSQLVQPEWFDDVIVGPGLQRLHYILLSVPHGYHENADRLTQVTHLSTEFKTAHSRHVDVQQSQIKRMLLHNF